MANVKHAVFVSSDIRATRAGHMLNLVHTEDCDNGTIWAKGEPSKDKNSREVYKAAAAKTTDTGCYWFCSAVAKSQKQGRSC